MNGYYRFKRDFTVYPTSRYFLKKKKTKMELLKTRVARPHISDNEGGEKGKDRTKKYTNNEKLQEGAYRANERKIELFLKDTTWLGHEIGESSKELKSFHGAIQNIASFLPRLQFKNMTQKNSY